jgi:hypothetical protein
VPPACVHVDLDGASDIFRSRGWQFEGEDTVFESGMRGALDCFDANGIKATLFVIASSLDEPRKRDLIREAMQRGHEIASHTTTHSNLLKQDAANKRQEIGGSRARLERELGVTVRGFRAPGYNIDREGLELLADCGYEWDSSACPTPVFSQRLGISLEALASPTEPLAGRAFLELPLPDHRPSPVPFSPSYAHLLGLTYYRWGVRRSRRRGGPLVMLFHLIDFADPLPSGQLNGLMSKVTTLSHVSGDRKRRRCRRMLDELTRQYRVVTTTALISEVQRQRL